MGEDGRAVALDMLIEPDAGAGLGHDRCERGLADLKRIAPQIVAIQFDEVDMLPLARWWRTRSNEATPLSSQATASPSMMQERERRRPNVSTISGKRWVRSLLALRLRKAAFEIGLLRHRGGPIAARRAEVLKFYATLGNGSMV
jgi:hypothetical protein